MTEKPLVSVIINCYNGEKYLREAIDSVIAQTYENWELVFWDNQSTDASREIVESYNSPKIRYFYAPEHTSLGEARNLALEKVTGVFLTFLDTDDIWLPGFLERGMEILNVGCKYVGYFPNFIDKFPNTERIHNDTLKSREEGIKELLNYYHICMSGAIIRVSIIKGFNVRFTKNYNLIEDLDFYTTIASYGTLYYDEEPLVKYRANFSSLTHTKSGMWYTEYSQFITMLEEKYVRVGLLQETDLENMRRLKVDAYVELLIQENNKYGVLKTFFSNITMFPVLWKKLLFVIVGKDRYLELRNKRNLKK